MPEISRFFGVSIRMYFDDHEPPHFHAIYAGHEAQVGIDPIMVLEWAALHQRELAGNWRRLRDDRPVEGIEPLE
jgi:hypothetical protein